MITPPIVLQFLDGLKAQYPTGSLVFVPYTQVGSKATGGVPGPESDDDWLFLVPTQFYPDAAHHILRDKLGMAYGGSGEDGDTRFFSWKKDGVNILITDDRIFYELWQRSVEVCRYANHIGCPMTKDERINIHRIIMDDNTLEDILK